MDTEMLIDRSDILLFFIDRTAISQPYMIAIGEQRCSPRCYTTSRVTRGVGREIFRDLGGGRRVPRGLIRDFTSQGWDLQARFRLYVYSST